jgi:hypothetical protein
MKKFHIERLNLGKFGYLKIACPESTIRSVFFLGLGQQGRNLSWVAKSAPEGMAIVEGLPYMKALSIAEMRQLGFDATQTVFEKVGGLSSLIIFAESQAAVATIETIARRTRDAPKKIVLLSPLGMNPSAFGRSDKERYRKFLYKSFRMWTHPDQSLVLSANRETLKFIAKDSVQYPHKVKLASSFACKQNIVSQVNELAATVPVHVFVGEHDELFPYSEILEEAGAGSRVQVHSLGRVGHMNRGTEKGMRQFLKVYSIVE